METTPSSNKGSDSSISNDPRISKVTSALKRLRYYRLAYDARRAAFYRQYLGQRDGKMYPDNITPRANTFIQYPLSNVEQIVSRVDDAFFSFDPWFEALPRSEGDQAAAENMGQVLSYMLNRSNFKSAFEELVRNICIYGHAGIQVDWDFDYDMVNYMEPTYLMDGDQPKMFNTPMGPQPLQIGSRPATKPVPRLRPRFSAIDVYDLLVDPDGDIIARLSERTIAQMKREMQTNPDTYDPQAFQQLINSANTSKPSDPDSLIVRLAEVWDHSEQTHAIVTFSEDAQAIGYKDLRASYRGTTYSSYKRDVLGGQPICLYFGQNPFNHKRTPILHTSFIKLPNEVFGLGAIEIISDLTESMNKMVNMVTDNWNLGINRRYAYDTGADIDHEALNNFNTPGGKVGVSGNPSDVIMPLPFFTPQTGDYQILEIYRGMIEMASGISDFYAKGVGSPTNNKTATGINSVMNESNYRFKLFIRNLELDILQPLLAMCASMVQQYVSDPMEVQMTGQNPAIPKWVVMSPEDLVGGMDFQMVAANYATNKIIRQRNFLALMNIAAQSPYLNQLEALKEGFKLFEVPNSGKLLYTEQQVQQMQAAQLEEQVQMMMLESALDTESKARIGQSKPKPSASKTQGSPHKRTAQFEGKIPGAGLTSHIKDLAQNLTGSNAMGLEGMGQK